MIYTFIRTLWLRYVSLFWHAVCSIWTAEQNQPNTVKQHKIIFNRRNMCKRTKTYSFSRPAAVNNDRGASHLRGWFRAQETNKIRNLKPNYLSGNFVIAFLNLFLWTIFIAHLAYANGSFTVVKFGKKLGLQSETACVFWHTCNPKYVPAIMALHCQLHQVIF